MILAFLPQRTNVSTRYIPVKPIVPVQLCLAPPGLLEYNPRTHWRIEWTFSMTQRTPYPDVGGRRALSQMELIQ